jgi:micrococcal nuclease
MTRYHQCEGAAAVSSTKLGQALANGRRRRLLALCALLLAFAGNCRPANAETFTADVVAVLDGDTIGVLRATPAGPREQRVRLWGIDAPEKAQAYGTKAKQALSAMVWGKRVQVDVRDTDRYGRLVAKLTAAGQAVNAELVNAGMAWWYQRYAPAARELQSAELQARRDRRGLWADAAPVPPWEWRRAGASAPSAAPTLTPPSAQAGAVYVTRTGKAYHRAGCAYAAHATGAVSRAEATSRGLAPCRVCRP